MGNPAAGRGWGGSPRLPAWAAWRRFRDWASPLPPYPDPLPANVLEPWLQTGKGYPGTGVCSGGVFAGDARRGRAPLMPPGNRRIIAAPRAAEQTPAVGRGYAPDTGPSRSPSVGVVAPAYRCRRAPISIRSVSRTRTCTLRCASAWSMNHGSGRLSEVGRAHV